MGGGDEVVVKFACPPQGPAIAHCGARGVVPIVGRRHCRRGSARMSRTQCLQF
jgi:hypothetical protein